MPVVIECISCTRTELRNYSGALFCYECQGQRAIEQDRAIKAVGAAVKRGFLPRAAECVCEDCNAPAQHYDHRDYTEPLEVDPVCARCNTRRGPALDSQMRALPPQAQAGNIQAADASQGCEMDMDELTKGSLIHGRSLSAVPNIYVAIGGNPK